MDCMKILDSFLRFVSHESGLVIEDCGKIVPELSGNYLILPEGAVDQMQEALCDLYPDKAPHIRMIFSREVEDEIKSQVLLPVINENSTYTDLLVSKYGGINNLLNNYDVNGTNASTATVTEPVEVVEEVLKEEEEELTEMERQELEDLRKLMVVKNQEVEDLNKQLASKDSKIEDLEGKVKEHEELISTKDETIKYLNEKIKEVEEATVNNDSDEELMSGEDIISVFEVVSTLPDSQVVEGLQQGLRILKESEVDANSEEEIAKIQDDRFFILSEMLKGLNSIEGDDSVVGAVVRMFEDSEFASAVLNTENTVSARDAFLQALNNLNEKEDFVGMTNICKTLYQGLTVGMEE